MTSIDIFGTSQAFEQKAMEIFRFQAQENPIYQSYLSHLGIDFSDISKIEDIPFLPISFFKTHRVICDHLQVDRVFQSSGTGGERSKHFLADTSLYEASFIINFEREFGSLDEICILGLLPNYQENPNSSLLYMMNELMERTESNGSQYLSLDQTDLKQILQQANKSQLKTILVGVSFALMDLAEQLPMDLSNVIIMETGGMKGQRKEITRESLHNHLKKAFNHKQIMSEYGMCELLSQAYSHADGIFNCPSWMKVYTRPMHDPFGEMELGRTGVVKIIDLANIYSCSFIETEDIGKVYKNGSFEILGRLDHTQLRGCNLMFQAS